jgi:hypothetical protein
MEDHMIAAHFISLVFKFRGKEFALSNPRHKDMVAFPEVEIKNAFLRNPFQFALRRFARLELPSQTVPLAFVDVIGFFVAMFQI